MGKHMAKLLKKAREEAGLSQWDVADFIGYDSPQFISNIERELSQLPRDKLPLVCEITKRNKKEFFEAYKDDYRDELIEKIKGLDKE